MGAPRQPRYDLAGEKFGTRRVTTTPPRRTNGKWWWEVVCACGAKDLMKTEQIVHAVKSGVGGSCHRCGGARSWVTHAETHVERIVTVETRTEAQLLVQIKRAEDLLRAVTRVPPSSPVPVAVVQEIEVFLASIPASVRAA